MHFAVVPGVDGWASAMGGSREAISPVTANKQALIVPWGSTKLCPRPEEDHAWNGKQPP